MARLEAVPLPINTVLVESEQRPRHVHFITSGMASLVTTMSDGASVEVGIVSREGLPETTHLLGPIMGQTRCFMQIPGTAYRMDFLAFQRSFFQDEHIHARVLQYAQYQTNILSQLGACNRLHEVEERLARWLLMVQDRVGESELLLTQEFLGFMLGSRRTTVTMIAGLLQRSGLIDYQRGKVRILNRENLISAACECYPITQKLLGALYSTNGHTQ